MRCATSTPMRPRPTTPRVFSRSSTPVYLLRFHSPFFSAALACGMLRAVATSRPQASSAAVTMLEVGALTTITPALVAAETSTLSRPTPARATTFSLLRGGDGLGVDLGGGADQDRVDVGDGGEQLGAVRAVAVPDLEVRAERVDGGGRQLFSDEYDRFRAHVSPHKSNADGRPDGRRRWRGGYAAWKTHDAVGLTRMLCSSVVARRGASCASAEGSPVRGWTGWTRRRQACRASAPRAERRRRGPRSAYASSSTQLISLRSSLPVVSSRWFSSAFLYSLYFCRPRVVLGHPVRWRRCRPGSRRGPSSSRPWWRR